MKIILSPHGGSGNHGCEAIVRSTVKILNDIEFELFSTSPEEDARYGLNECCKLSASQKSINRFSIGYLIARINGSGEKFDRLAFAPILQAAKKSDMMMSIGGDNYCYGINNHILLVNSAVRELGKKSVLWGCSIEEEAINNGIIYEDLAAFDLIIARESITYNSLKRRGLSKVSLFPDPAFQLDRIDLPLPEGFKEGNTVGVNISPMIISYETNKDSAFNNYIKLIEYIIATSDMSIALIPHVVWAHNDDRKPLLKLYNRFAHTGRVIMIEDAVASELKGYIARCRFFIAARTHASIAAYSECVPTLVVGYSVKARGIARDIFGTENNYVIPVQSLKKDDQLVMAFQYIYEHEADIRNHYALNMEQYKAKAAEAGKEIIEI
ncbi:polysaccharide pyruvyl transferase family protein [Dysgonomonas sp. Marseille-P4677]|uniref:polysaccharide pyruvyl transferase family protein n=1 Tax=Dysgonomonas sp. Marseille-P4677 TaxID=2364790 RepID=UPI001912270F|nr:polysaccharide pyruvyl transferase family protein [Dysgonomonas sp. Marseille-P4677]MBK5721508.1 polysaccharide pyruvyl transferase family protein [Dysgonomonas sp. Marseille-P4677]